MSDDDQRMEVGDLVETESGSVYPVVGREQGGRTLQLPNGPGGATREFFRKDLELYEKDATLYQAYRSGMNHQNIDNEVAEAVASLITEGYLKQESLPVLFTTLGEDVAIKIADKLE